MALALHELSVVELAEAVRAGKQRAVDLVEHHLERIGSRDAALGAFFFLDAEGARRSARAVDAAVARGKDPGPLAGIPFGVKELEDVEGWPHPRGPGCVGLPNVRNYGVLTRDVRDTTRLLDCVMGPDERDPLSLPHPGLCYEAGLARVDLAGTRVAWTEDLGFGVCDPALARVVRGAADALIGSARLDERELAVRLPDPEQAWRVLGSPDLRSLYAPFLPERAEDVSPFVRMAFEASQALGVDDFGRAALLRDALVQALADLFDAVDLLLLPTVSMPAFAAEGPMPTTIAGRSTSPLSTAAQTYVFNLSRHPAVSVPAGVCGAAPVGLQIVGRRHEDLRVLAAAAALESARPWPLLAPQ